ncbi:nucleolin-like [Phalaenopsis equestris]|uniref:nucleolin-like n=1 Tax=Phalaenopsis equestris TaxID=78828 RepID=UPI0009E19243|nr:nucleolin-like [Phalaenopsis equestris]
MPPARKSLASKPSAKSKDSASASESSPVNASTSFADVKTPETEAHSTLRDNDSSEADAVNAVAPADGKTTESPAMFEEPADPAGKDSINQLESEEPSGNEDVEFEDEEANDAVAKMEADEGVEKTFHKVNTIDEVEYEATGSDDAEGVDGDDDNSSDADVDNDENEENDQTLDTQAALAEGKKQKESEIFVGGLDKEAVEDDLIKFFGVFGDVQSARIVRNPKTKRSKGFAFIRFANCEHTMKALADLKDGTEIKGKHVRIQASQDNNTLYLGNISKTWTKDNVIERLKSLGVEDFNNMILPSDPKNEEKIKGFAFLEFSSHSDAILAFQRLRKPDADFGRDTMAKVAFAHTSLHPNEDDIMRVKTVHFDGIPTSWDEEKVKEICKDYGQIERVLLSRNLNSRKRKNFGFVEFSSHESALACVEGINKAQIVVGDEKVVANLARSKSKGRSKGGFKKKNVETIHEAGGSGKKRKASEVFLKDKRHNTKISKVSTPFTSQKRDYKGKSGLQASMSLKRSRNSRKATDANDSGRSSRKMHQNNSYGKARDQYSDYVGNHKRSYSASREADSCARTNYAGYAAPSTNYAGYAYARTSEPQLHPSDLVPHAGYIPAHKQGTSSYLYDRRRPETYNSEPPSNFGSDREISGVSTSYLSDYSDYQGAGYRHDSSGAYPSRGPYYY